ncbi:F-box protein CPR1-like [Corylus avellana]|uniref:F-box protein CPR1-like n=1 Tax=Corylus avellana TaxID=13451 RepID=UPI00286C2292|nr:F-box protein CPR1-like [Corylus avellana]
MNCLAPPLIIPKIFRNVIVSFNMKDEAFGEVALPKSLQGLDHLSFSVALLDGLLAIVPRNELGNEAFQAVWVMKEYGVAESWTKLFDVPIRRSENVFGFTKSGEVLVPKGGGLLSLGPSSRGYVDLHIYDTQEIFLDTYVESLVLLR